jgi:large subunit ribosomal protein L2
MRKTGGRNNTGRITVRHIGGGHKRRYRLIDFHRNYFDQPGVVQRLEYDPNRSAWIALLTYNDGKMSYILAPQGLKTGDTVISSKEKEVDIKPGNAMPLSMMPIGAQIHNVELQPGKGGQLARSAGTSCQLLEKNVKPGYALVRLQSKEHRLVLDRCMATIGAVSNPMHKHEKWGKAGRSRNKGIRPTVRGVAMNPVDHPHGGGEGRAGPGRPSVSYSGVLAKGFKTRNKRKSRKLIVVPRGGLKKQAGNA